MKERQCGERTKTKRDITSREGGLIGDRREWNAFCQLLVQYHSIRQQGKQGKATEVGRKRLSGSDPSFYSSFILG